MRVCPKCGCVDPPFWKQCAFRQNISYCTLGDIEYWTPSLAKLLNKNSFVDDEFYAYHLTKGKRVERTAKVDNPTWKTNWYIGTFERSIHNKLPSHLRTPSTIANKTLADRRNQTKLLEVKT